MALSPSFSLLGLQTTPSFGLFDIFIPLGTLPGIYAVNNDFRLLGGLSDTDQLDLANVGFTVVATPEPGSLVTLVAGLGAIAALRRIRPLASTAPNGCQ